MHRGRTTWRRFRRKRKSTAGRFATVHLFPCSWKISFVGKDQFNTVNFVHWKLGPLFVFVVIKRMFSSWVRHRTLRLLFKDCRSFYFYSLIKSTFLVGKGLSYFYNKEKNTWLLVDMKFLLLCSTRHLISENIFQEQGENWPVANLLVVDFRSQLDCRICRKEGENLHD